MRGRVIGALAVVMGVDGGDGRRERLRRALVGPTLGPVQLQGVSP